MNRQDNQTITITFGDVAENHPRMQKLGTLSDKGFSVVELKEMQKRFVESGCKCELVDLGAILPKDLAYKEKEDGIEAVVLVVRKGVDALLEHDPEDGDSRDHSDMFNELVDLKWDKKAKMKGKVVNKHARWNLCFDDIPQEPDYLQGKGRIIPYKDVPLTKKAKTRLKDLVGKRADSFTFVGEGNYYYDVKKCYIGAHGDGERRKVVGLRLGASFPLFFQWYLKGEKIGERIRIDLESGDLYVMSDLAVGWNWLKRNVPTLRHSAGFPQTLRYAE